MHHVFICYPRTFQAHVTPLHDALELALRNIYRRDAQVFQDTSDLEAGNKWAADVDAALDHARVMIVVVVPTILQSPQCRREMLRFIDTPGKHIVPLTCEEVPRLARLAASVDDHVPGTEAHEIAVCARALQTWQNYDFTQHVYRKAEETEYAVAIADLARMIRNKLDAEDHAEPVGADPDPPPRPDPPRDLAKNVPGGGQGRVRKSRRGLVGVALLALLAVGGFALWSLRTPPTEPVERVTAVRAQALLSRALAEAAGQAGADHLGFDPASATLQVSAPPIGTTRARIPLQPTIDPMLGAGFVPGFATDSRDGDTCFVIQGDPLVLESSELSGGATVSVRLRVYERAEPEPQKVCLTAESTWRPVEARSAVVGNGAILAAPREDARRIRTLRSGQRVPGPFWTSEDVPGWVRMEYRDSFAFLPRDLIRELE